MLWTPADHICSGERMQALNSDVFSMNSDLSSQSCYLSGCLSATSRVCWRMSAHGDICSKELRKFVTLQHCFQVLAGKLAKPFLVTASPRLNSSSSRREKNVWEMFLCLPQRKQHQKLFLFLWELCLASVFTRLNSQNRLHFGKPSF